MQLNRFKSASPKISTAILHTVRSIGCVLTACLLALFAFGAGSAHAGRLPEWSLTKTANPTTYTAAAQMITYTYVITNIKNPFPNTGILKTLTDSKIGAININTACTSTTMGGNTGDKITCTAVYTTTAADVTAGSVTNMNCQPWRLLPVGAWRARSRHSMITSRSTGRSKSRRFRTLLVVESNSSFVRFKIIHLSSQLRR